MKLNSVLLALLIAGLVLAVVAQYLANNRLQAEVVQLRHDSEELQVLRAGGETTNAAKVQVSGEELARLRKENRVLRMERDILKKAAAFFAKQHR